VKYNIITVNQLNQYLKKCFDNDLNLASVCVKGELSNYKVYPSGHHYFTLKDSESSLRCVMFRYQAGNLRFRPENGMQVIAIGKVSVFPRDGAYQLYCEALSPIGAGDLQVAFEQLKNKLLQEGLFDESHKKPIPKYPERIALITSSAGAAVHDMIRVIRKRYPRVKLLLVPAKVQGKEAPEELIAAIRLVNDRNLADTIILGRGGGSAEDLWCFNDEQLAHAIYESRIPIISAVGHEPDVTISDYVADLRAATPSNGAELATPDQAALRELTGKMQQIIQRAVSQVIERKRHELELLAARDALKHPLFVLDSKRMELDYLERNMQKYCDLKMSDLKTSLIQCETAIQALSPYRVLERGYALAEDEFGGLFQSVTQVKKGDSLKIRFADGEIKAVVFDVINRSIDDGIV